jgi:hypothetical protein
MLDTTELEILAESKERWARKRAQMALAICDQYNGGGLEEFEFQDIMLRLVEDGDLDREATDLETKSNLIIAINTAAGTI